MKYDVWLWRTDAGSRCVVEANSGIEAARVWLEGATAYGAAQTLGHTIAVRRRVAGRRSTELFEVGFALRRLR